MEQKDKKVMDALYSHTLIGIVDAVNAKGIQKDDIVQVIKTNDGFILLFYK